MSLDDYRRWQEQLSAADRAMIFGMYVMGISFTGSVISVAFLVWKVFFG